MPKAECSALEMPVCLFLDGSFPSWLLQPRKQSQLHDPSLLSLLSLFSDGEQFSDSSEDLDSDFPPCFSFRQSLRAGPPVLVVALSQVPGWTFLHFVQHPRPMGTRTICHKYPNPTPKPAEMSTASRENPAPSTGLDQKTPSLCGTQRSRSLVITSGEPSMSQLL